MHVCGWAFCTHLLLLTLSIRSPSASRSVGSIDLGPLEVAIARGTLSTIAAALVDGRALHAASAHVSLARGVEFNVALHAPSGTFKSSVGRMKRAVAAEFRRPELRVCSGGAV